MINVWLSSKPWNIYPRMINSDLVPRPPTTNHTHYLVYVAEEQMDDVTYYHSCFRIAWGLPVSVKLLPTCASQIALYWWL